MEATAVQQPDQIPATTGAYNFDWNNWADLSAIVLAFDGDLALGPTAAEPEVDDEALEIRMLSL